MDYGNQICSVRQVINDNCEGESLCANCSHVLADCSHRKKEKTDINGFTCIVKCDGFEGYVKPPGGE